MKLVQDGWRQAWRTVRIQARDPSLSWHRLWPFGLVSDWAAAKMALHNRTKKDELHIVGVTPRERLAYFKKHRLIPTAYPKNKL